MDGQLIHTRRDGSLISVYSRWNLQQNPHTQTISVVESNSALPYECHLTVWRLVA